MDQQELTLFVAALFCVSVILFNSYRIYKRCDKWEEGNHPTTNTIFLTLIGLVIMFVIGFGIKNAVNQKLPGLKMPSVGTGGVRSAVKSFARVNKIGV
tara:strand:- start:737 stop:1030 length:294 start_codon:yes stop_codon:yes gene_type:complete